MPIPETDRDLLFGILALRMDLVTRDPLVASIGEWSREKRRTLGEILVEAGAIDPGARTILDPMVDLHVASLAALGTVDVEADDLRRTIVDPGVLDSLATVAPSLSPDTSSIPITASRDGARYRKLYEHARGGLGVVFVAKDEELNREVALKEIQDRLADHPHHRSKFLLEAEVTGGLEHPGIVPVHGLGHYEDGRPFYAMRFIKGDSLKESIARFHDGDSNSADPGERTLALQKLLRRFIDVCNAIDYAHSRGVLHRDLKPQNVMVGPYGETLVVDWGLAKTLGRLAEGDEAGRDSDADQAFRAASSDGSLETLPGSLIGTPAYMSPEQAAGRLDLLRPASDIYGLGATLYHLLTGKPPFCGATLASCSPRSRPATSPAPDRWPPGSTRRWRRSA